MFHIKSVREAYGIGLNVSDGFAVLMNSVVANPVSNSLPSNLVSYRDKLIKEGVIDNNFKFVKDYIFTSPSTAASVIMGRNANGRKEWKTKGNKSLKQLEESL